jgi:uncharacterized lipoprotein YehR (DUF1307 family)
MKKVLSLVFAALLSIAFTACGDDAETTTAVETTTTQCVPAPGEICPS